MRGVYRAAHSTSELGGNRWPPRVGSQELSLSLISHPSFRYSLSLSVETEHLSVIDSPLIPQFIPTNRSHRVIQTLARSLPLSLLVSTELMLHLYNKRKTYIHGPEEALPWFSHHKLV